MRIYTEGSVGLTLPATVFVYLIFFSYIQLSVETYYSGKENTPSEQVVVKR